MKRPFGMKRFPFFILIAIPAFFLFGLLVMYLWNNVLVEVTPVKPVTYWQGIGVFVLFKILFGFGGGGGGKRWNNDMKNRWSRLTPEEKERLKEKFGKHTGRWDSNTSSSDAVV